MSEYVFRAVLENRSHPEYGVVSLPFPIPAERYDHVIEDLLAPMQVGSPTMQDCVVKEVDAGSWPILKSLEGQCVNVDELDYLAKRLESFSMGEDAQFQGMAHKLGIIGLKDLINLTFCCQKATVIDNFRDLEKAGKDHLMNLNGGSMLMEELEKADGKAVAEELIRSGSGKITPYGLVFDNGMELEQLYRGKEFPGYLYDRPEVVLTVVPFDAPADTTPTFLYLPCPQSQIDRSLQRGGLYGTEQMRVGVDCDFLPVEVSNALELENETFQSLNEMCRVVHGLSGEDKVKLNVVIECASPSSAFQIARLAENLELFDFAPHAQTPEELGEYMVKESGRFEYDPNLEDFYDFRKLGERRVKEHPGCFTEKGYISYEGALPLEALMSGEQQAQGPEMGGMA